MRSHSKADLVLARGRAIINTKLESHEKEVQGYFRRCVESVSSGRLQHALEFLCIPRRGNITEVPKDWLNTISAVIKSRKQDPTSSEKLIETIRAVSSYRPSHNALLRTLDDMLVPHREHLSAMDCVYYLTCMPADGSQAGDWAATRILQTAPPICGTQASALATACNKRTILTPAMIDYTAHHVFSEIATIPSSLLIQCLTAFADNGGVPHHTALQFSRLPTMKSMEDDHDGVSTMDSAGPDMLTSPVSLSERVWVMYDCEILEFMYICWRLKLDCTSIWNEGCARISSIPAFDIPVPLAVDLLISTCKLTKPWCEIVPSCIAEFMGILLCVIEPHLTELKDEDVRFIAMSVKPGLIEESIYKKFFSRFSEIAVRVCDSLASHLHRSSDAGVLAFAEGLCIVEVLLRETIEAPLERVLGQMADNIKYMPKDKASRVIHVIRKTVDVEDSRVMLLYLENALDLSALTVDEAISSCIALGEIVTHPDVHDIFKSPLTGLMELFDNCSIEVFAALLSSTRKLAWNLLEFMAPCEDMEKNIFEELIEAKSHDAVDCGTLLELAECEEYVKGIGMTHIVGLLVAGPPLSINNINRLMDSVFKRRDAADELYEMIMDACVVWGTDEP